MGTLATNELREYLRKYNAGLLEISRSNRVLKIVLNSLKANVAIT